MILLILYTCLWNFNYWCFILLFHCKTTIHIIWWKTSIKILCWVLKKNFLMMVFYLSLKLWTVVCCAFHLIISPLNYAGNNIINSHHQYTLSSFLRRSPSLLEKPLKHTKGSFFIVLSDTVLLVIKIFQNSWRYSKLLISDGSW